MQCVEACEGQQPRVAWQVALQGPDVAALQTLLACCSGGEQRGSPGVVVGCGSWGSGSGNWSREDVNCPCEGQGNKDTRFYISQFGLGWPADAIWAFGVIFALGYLLFWVNRAVQVLWLETRIF
jgi:hypothetical protein